MHEILEQLERLLTDERSAIRKLDVDGIDKAASAKSELEKKLGEALGRGIKPLPADRALLERVRTAARANQLLLVHARACVRGVVSIVSGRLPDAYPQTVGNAAPMTSATSVRMNVTG